MDLIFSDIHANLHALKALLRYAKRRSFERFVFLGDLVGYGAQPNQVIERMLEIRHRYMVRGNHDRACTHRQADPTFSLPARAAAAWTLEHLSQDHRHFLQELPEGLQQVDDQYCIAHGAPHDEDAYLLHPHDALLAFQAFHGSLCFYGHTHIPGGFELDFQAKQLNWLSFLEDEWFQLRPGCRYLINPGSLGQPRDRDSRIAFMNYDPDKRRLRLLRLDYDKAGAAKAILSAGLNPNLAERLYHGI
jgi:predicted phosphodiesterase